MALENVIYPIDYSTNFKVIKMLHLREYLFIVWL